MAFSKRKSSTNVKEIFPMPAHSFSNKTDIQQLNEDAMNFVNKHSIPNTVAQTNFNSTNKLSRPLTAFFSNRAGSARNSSLIP